MSSIDWLVLCVTLLSIIFYGVWKGRGSKNIEGYLLADRQLPWYHVGLSVMATQASAITFLSAPGQGYTDGLRFIQFYFGLPLAMVVLCVTFIPIFHKLKVFTAYEFLEQRFDGKTRLLTAVLFLLQRGLSTGITIYAPAIILSTILNIDIVYTIILNGIIVIAYTMYGGAKTVSYTQIFQMSVIFFGLFLAAYMVVHLLPADVSFFDAMHIAGKMDRVNAIDTHFDLNNRYNLWSGLIGGFFLQLSYFGTDQSQVGRYLTGSSVKQSRLGLVMNGLLKIPMQFLILLTGVMVFTFYQFQAPPLLFNQVEVNKIENSRYSAQYKELEKEFENNHSEKKEKVNALVTALHSGNEAVAEQLGSELRQSMQRSEAIRTEAKNLLEQNDKKAETNDANYIFLRFVTTHLPVGIVGLLVAVIFLASMGSMASGLSSLASTTVVDFYKRLYRPSASDTGYLSASRWITVAWGVFCIITALYASKIGNLIEVVNILGSLFYGTILGIFLVAFYMKKTGGSAVFAAALLAELFVVFAWKTELTAFLWLNLIGCLLVMGLSWLIQKGIDLADRS